MKLRIYDVSFQDVLKRFFHTKLINKIHQNVGDDLEFLCWTSSLNIALQLLLFSSFVTFGLVYKVLEKV